MSGMKVVSTHTYAAPLEEVFAALTNPDAVVEKYTALGHRDITLIEHKVTDGAVSVRSRRGIPMQVPGFAKRLLSPVNTVEQLDEWTAPAADGTRTGTWRADGKGVPVKVGGTLRLAPTKAGTVMEIHAEVNCSLPLIGGKIASFVGAEAERSIHAEEAFTDGFLATKKRPSRRKAASKTAP
jgi:hypothetical protein